MRTTKFIPWQSAKLAGRLSMLGVILGVGVSLPGCVAVPVNIVDANHPANAVANSAPLAEMSDVLDAQAIEATEAPVMDHSMHGM